MSDPAQDSMWAAVILTVSSEGQAGLCREEIARRARDGRLAAGTEYLVVADPDGARLGTGGATIHALGRLAAKTGEPGSWWKRRRALMIHSGGESRRLPQYAPQGKLFSVLPSEHGRAETTTVFDETSALSAAWIERMPPGLLVALGDVILRFDPDQVDWSRPGVTGVAMRLPVETGRRHGVYVSDERGRVYTFLQKPAAEEVEAAGGLIGAGACAVDTGLLYLDAETAARLTELAGLRKLPAMDLYDHFTKALTGQWKPEPDAGAFWRLLAESLRGVPFHCSVVDGEFVHLGTTRSFRAAAAAFGGVLDSAITGPCETGPEAVVMECELEGSVRASRGAVLHGLTGISGPVEVPEDTVLHQLPVCAGERPGAKECDWVIRVYGVEDDPKEPLERATWFGRPFGEAIQALGLRAEEVWPRTGEPPSLWTADLFPAGAVEEAWECAKWMMGLASAYGPGQWRAARRMSLAESSRCADGAMLVELRSRRARAQWRRTIVDLAESGADLRPVLAHSPGLPAVAAAGRALLERARETATAGAGSENSQGCPPLTHAASLFVQASRLLARAGLRRESDEARDTGFRCVERAVEAGIAVGTAAGPWRWCAESVTVAAPPRIDLGGGWSDTPPFCLDWGGTVLNIALEIDGGYPIETTVRRLREPVVRCIAEGTDEIAEYRTREELLGPAPLDSPFTVPRTAVRLRGAPPEGGIEICCRVKLPVGSGLGTSSILAATVIRALAEIRGETLPDPDLSDEVMRLEQLMTTGGGWQDQAGGIFPGAKLLATGPGLRQRIRVKPVEWTPERQEEFCRHLVLFNTGIQRMAKNLLRQVVTGYLARETAAVQVLHSLKTLALEMSCAMAEGEWRHLGELLDRHWRLNQVLDPNTTNGPINALLEKARPYLYGAKLAGAGGGGFVILLARDPEAAAALRRKLGSGVCEFRVAGEGMKVAAE